MYCRSSEVIPSIRRCNLQILLRSQLALRADIQKMYVPGWERYIQFTDSVQFSNYWTANLYFKAKNGTYKRVPQVPNRDLFNDKYTGKTKGGFVVYYVSPGKGKVTAFKPGFRMLVGDANNRVSKNLKSQTCFRCYTGPNFGGDNAAPCQDAKYVSCLLISSSLRGLGSIPKACQKLPVPVAFDQTFFTPRAGMERISIRRTIKYV